MGLNIVTQAGDFDPFVKYNGKAGRWYVQKDEQEVEVSNPVFVADFDKIKTGWFYFKTGSAPEKVFDKSLSEAAPKPERTFVDDKGVVRDCFRRGFELRLFSNAHFGGVVVMNGSSMHLNNAINALYDAYEAGKAANPGMLPVVACSGTEPMKDKHGTNYKPLMSIVKWVARPVELDSGAVSAPATQAPQPVPQPAPAPAASISEF